MERGKRKGSIVRILEKVSQTKIAGQALSELERLLSLADVGEQDLLKLYILSKNSSNKNIFASTPYTGRVLFLPQCLRSRECKAPLSDEGYLCQGCGRCSIKEVKQEAETLGYRVFILPGGSMAEKIFKSVKPKACLGVACMKELVLGCFVSDRYDVTPYTVTLLRDGCSNTEVDLGSLRSAITLSSLRPS